MSTRSDLLADLSLKEGELRDLKRKKDELYAEADRRRERAPVWARGEGSEAGVGPDYSFYDRQMDSIERDIDRLKTELRSL